MHRQKNWPECIELFPGMTRRDAVAWTLKAAVFAYPLSGRLLAATSPTIGFPATELQPLVAQVKRLADAMAYLGEPFSEAERQRLDAAANLGDGPRAIDEIQRILDPRCLLAVRINPESRISVERGAAPAHLVEHGWRAYLVKVRNEAGVTGALVAESPQARPVYRRGTGLSMVPRSVLPADVADRWLALDMFADKPLEPQLSGLDLEYRIVLLYSRDRGKREAQIGALLGPATQDIGFRNRVAVLFDIAPSHDVTCRVRDEKGLPAVASFVIRGPRQARVPGAIEAAGAGFLLPGPDLSRRRRDRPASIGSVHGDVWPRARIHARDAHHHHRRLLREPITGLHAAALDRSARARMVFRRSSHPRRRLQPLREPDRGRAAGGHDAARPRRSAQRRRGAELGTELLSPAPVLRGRRTTRSPRRRRCCATTSRSRDSRRATAGISCCCALKDQDYPDVRQIEDWPSWDLPILQVGKGTGGDHGVRTLGPGAAGREPRSAELRHAAVRRDRRQRIHRRRDARRRGFHLDGGHAVRPRAEHLVPHAQLRIQDPRQRRDGLPLHVRRARRRGPLLRPSSAGRSITTRGATACATAAAMSRTASAI